MGRLKNLFLIILSVAAAFVGVIAVGWLIFYVSIAINILAVLAIGASLICVIAYGLHELWSGEKPRGKKNPSHPE